MTLEGKFTSYKDNQFKGEGHEVKPDDELLNLKTPAGALRAISHIEEVPAEGVWARLLKQKKRIPSLRVQLPGDKEITPIDDLSAQKVYHVDGQIVTVEVVYHP